MHLHKSLYIFTKNPACKPTPTDGNFSIRRLYYSVSLFFNVTAITPNAAISETITTAKDTVLSPVSTAASVEAAGVLLLLLLLLLLLFDRLELLEDELLEDELLEDELLESLLDVSLSDELSVSG